jgi:hypothetical protein
MGGVGAHYEALVNRRMNLLFLKKLENYFAEQNDCQHLKKDSDQSNLFYRMSSYLSLSVITG